MKQLGISGLLLALICLAGCAATLSPQEQLNQSFRKSFDATGFNYTSRTQVTSLGVPPADSTDDKKTLAVGAGIGFLKGLTISADGAIDMKGKRSEVLYDLQYDRDNVLVSVKFPLYMDYNSQTIYVGSSIMTTILETVFPRAPVTRGKLIKINLQELLRESAENSPELSKLLGEERFSAKNIDLWNSAFKNGIMKTLAGLKTGTTREVVLTDRDRSAGVVRRIQVSLGHEDSVNGLIELIAAVAESLNKDGLLGGDEYTMLRSLTDRQQLEGVVDKFSLGLIFDVGVDAAGYAAMIESRFNVADAAGEYRLELVNLSTMTNFNAPHFTMKPESGDVVDFRELMNAVLEDTAKRLGDGGDNEDACEDDEEDGLVPMGNS